jgi:hypothetical protein
VAFALGTGSEWRRCPSHDAAQTDIEQLRQLSEAEHDALVAADTNRLETLLAADFTLVTPDAQTLTRDDLIAAVGSGDLDFHAFRFHEVRPRDAIEIRLDCDVATVSYRSEMDVTSDALHYRHDSRHTDTWVKGRPQLAGDPGADHSRRRLPASRPIELRLFRHPTGRHCRAEHAEDRACHGCLCTSQ